MKKKRKMKKKFVVFFSLYIVILSSYFFIRTFSKYSTSVNKLGSITVAKWDVSANIPTSDINLIAGNNIENYTLTVTSESEVATDYSIIISNLPDNIQVALDDDNYIDAVNGQVEFNSAGGFNANAANSSDTHVLKIKALVDADSQVNRKISVDVVFAQRQVSQS